MKFYGKNFSPKLRDLIQISNADTSPGDKLTLSEEVQIVRAVTGAQLDHFMEEAFNPANTPEERVGAAEIVKKCMTDVAAIVDKAARVRSLATDAATVEDIEYVINQVVGIVQQVVEPVDPILSRTLQDQISNIRLPGRHRDLPDPAKLLHKAVEEINTIENGNS